MFSPESRLRLVNPLLIVLAGISTTGIGENINLPTRVSPLPTNHELKMPAKVSSSPEETQLILELIKNYLADRNPFNRQHLTEGLNLAKISLPLEQTYDMQIEASQATFLERQFDLDNRFHSFLLNAILRLKLEARRDELSELIERNYQHLPNAEIYAAQTQMQQEEREKIIKNILWLFDKNPPITIDDDVYFPDSAVNHLNRHSQILQGLEMSGLPFPRKVKYIKYFQGAPGGAWYLDHNYPNEPFTIVITDRSGETSIVHEVGHFLSDATYLEPNNPRLRQISQAVYNTLTEDPNPIEDYAGRFEDFFLRGRNFRNRILSLRRFGLQYGFQSDLEEAQDLERKDFFMQIIFGGREFIKDGEILTWKYEVGSRVIIPDENANNLGIILRQEPYGNLDPSLPAVFPEDEVEILEGPKVGSSIDYRWWSQTLEYRIFWRVIICNQGVKSQFLLGDTQGKGGWIPEELLGKISQKENPPS